MTNIDQRPTWTLGQAIADQIGLCLETEVDPIHAWLAGAEFLAGLALADAERGRAGRLLVHRSIAALCDDATESVERVCDDDLEAVMRGLR